MKLLRFGDKGQEKPGLLDDTGQIRDLSNVSADFSEESVSLNALAKLHNLDIDTLPIVEGNPRIGSCLARVPNFFCIGLNYANHAKETGLNIPTEPIIFSKASSALAGPNDAVPLPENVQKADWEIELGVVIGQDCYRIEEDAALDYVAGYCVINDLSERHFQIERGGQWIKGKSLPGFGPIGPYLVTKDEIADPQNLNLSLKLNDETVQSSSTSDMIFEVKHIIAYMSQFMKLQCGDVIATGTPAGVGMSRNPPRFLRDGDTMACHVEGLGTQLQKVVSA